MTEVVTAVPDASLAQPEPGQGSLLNAISADPKALVYFLVNVGDGDAQVLLLPPDSNDQQRRLVVVDVAVAKKVPQLISALAAQNLVDLSPDNSLLRLVVATHPHYDHIGGMADFLTTFNQRGRIDEFWEPGYFFPTPPFHNLMAALEDSPWIRRLQPTSGTSLILDQVRLTVLGPGIGLRNRFDTYGVEINDSSITLMVEYPAAHVFAAPSAGGQLRRAAHGATRRLLLGGDAQFTSWAQTTVDFPDLQQTQNLTLVKELRTALGTDYLKADLVKIAHHGSKHGVNIELLERVAAPVALVSSVAGGGKYGFPHLLAMEAAREARQPTTTKNTPRETDQVLGIHVTGSKLDTGAAAGSIAVVVPSGPRAPLKLFRFGDSPAKPVDLTQARRVL
ncbi:MAG: MBL fold metallo-hydrolase [Nocardioides sp.]